MAYIQWEDSFSVGITEVDEQHKKLIGMLNALQEAVISDGKSSIKKVPEILEEAFDYVDYHFSTEEGLMTEFRDPDFTAHRKAHTDFVREILKFQGDYHKGIADLDLKLLDFLKNWLLNHILATDKKMGDFLISKKPTIL